MGGVKDVAYVFAIASFLYALYLVSDAMYSLITGRPLALPNFLGISVVWFILVAGAFGIIRNVVDWLGLSDND